MYYQMASLGKGSVAQLAYEWLFTRMDTLVFFQGAITGKAFFALLACKWPLTRM